MMPAPSLLVVDASVVVKWVLENEEFAAEARALLAKGLSQDRRLVGPPLLVAEATNAVYQRFRRGEMTGDDADRFVAHIWNQPVALLSPPDLTERAYRFVRRHRLANVYDSHYVVLAQALGVEFWTGDRRMFNSLQTVAPWVRWLGDYVPEDDDV